MVIKARFMSKTIRFIIQMSICFSIYLFFRGRERERALMPADVFLVSAKFCNEIFRISSIVKILR